MASDPSTGVITNGLMLAAMCGAVPGGVFFLLKQTDVPSRLVTKLVLGTCLLIYVPMLLALLSALIAVDSCGAAKNLFSWSCGILVFILFLIAVVWAIAIVATKVPSSWLHWLHMRRDSD